MLRLLRKPILLRDWIALGHHPANFKAVTCSQHKWELAQIGCTWNIQRIQNPKTGADEYWISQECRCRRCGTVRNFPLVEIIFK